MALPTEESAAQFTNIVTNVPLNCDFPLYVEEEIEVIYGTQALRAIYSTDYTVELNPLSDWVDFTVTPKSALLAKINALIATPPTDEPETNFVVVRRKLDYTTDSTPQVVRDTTFLSREIDRIHMKLIQLAERAARSVSLPATVIGDLLVEYIIGEPSEGKAPVWRGNKLVAEVDATDIAGAQGWAQDAQEAAEAAEAAAAMLPLTKYNATTNPTVNDDAADGYSIGSKWYNITAKEAYVCLDATPGAANWQQTTLTIDELAAGAFASQASQAEAEVGTNNTKFMTPLRVKQAQAILGRNPQAAAYALVAADCGKHVTITNGSAVNCTVNAGTIPDGGQVLIEQGGVGQITVVAGAGVTINKHAFFTAKLRGQYSQAVLTHHTGNVFTLAGHLEMA